MSRILRLIGFWLMAVTSAFIAAFAVGEALDDPGGWAAVGLIALWLVPLVLLCALAWWRPDPAVRVLAVLAAGVVGLSVWFALVPGAWRDLENQHGPVRVFVVWAVAAAVAVLGLKRTRVAGILLLVVGLAPLVIGGFRAGGLSSLSLVATPAVIAGVLYLVSAALSSRPPAEGEAGRADHARSGR